MDKGYRYDWSANSGDFDFLVHFDNCTALPDYCVFVTHNNLPDYVPGNLIIDVGFTGTSSYWPAFTDDLTDLCSTGDCEGQLT